MTKRAFLSHVSNEQSIAVALKQRLRRDFLGLLDVFVSSDGESIAAGEQWLVSVENALNECDMLITLCSPESIRRPWINFEAGAAWMRKIPLIPVCHAGLSPSDLPMPLSLRQGISLVETRGLQRLYAQIAKVLNCHCPEIDFNALAQELERIPATPEHPRQADPDRAALESERATRLRLLEALNHPRFKWRAINTLASIAAVSTDVVADLLRSDPNVRFSRGRTGNIIVGLRSRVGDTR